MPKVKRSKKPPPDGWELIEPTIDELDQKLREAEIEPHEGKRKVEGLWPIFRIHHQKSRYIYDLFYRRKAISRDAMSSNIITNRRIWKRVDPTTVIKDYKNNNEYKLTLSFGYTELYEYCLKENIADKNLIAKWKKQGYENLCCLRCIQTRDTNFGTNCICRVPKGKLEAGKIVECVHCGCRGCSG